MIIREALKKFNTFKRGTRVDTPNEFEAMYIHILIQPILEARAENWKKNLFFSEEIIIRKFAPEIS